MTGLESCLYWDRQRAFAPKLVVYPGQSGPYNPETVPWLAVLAVLAGIDSCLFACASRERLCTPPRMRAALLGVQLPPPRSECRTLGGYLQSFWQFDSCKLCLASF